MSEILTFGNEILSLNGESLAYVGEPPIPQYTMRVRYAQGVTPSFRKGSGTLVDSSNNIWDLTYDEGDLPNWSYMFENDTDLVEVISANLSDVDSLLGTFAGCSNLVKVGLFDTSHIRDMRSTFRWCNSLTEVPLFDLSNATTCERMFYLDESITYFPTFDTSNVVSFQSMFTGTKCTSYPNLNTSNGQIFSNMFQECSNMTQFPNIDTSNATDITLIASQCNSLISVPDLNVTNVTKCIQAFYGCRNVYSGSLNLYNKLSSNGKVTEYSSTFENCGRDTVSGRAELAQIPTSWGGDLAE